jgi:hypothetical protein
MWVKADGDLSCPVDYGNSHSTLWSCKNRASCPLGSHSGSTRHYLLEIASIVDQGHMP